MDHRFAFIGGLHRSGTTILHRCLADHPSVSGFEDTGVPKDEGQHLQSVYPPGKAFGGPGTFGFHEGAYLDETCRLAEPETGEEIFHQWAPFWDLGKPVLAEKSPPNLIRTRFLQELFDDARFIVMMRHPVVVALATLKWTDMDIEGLIEHWLLCYERYRRDRGWLECCLTLRYEHLTAYPDESLRTVWDHLGLWPQPPTRTIRDDLDRRYLARWRRLRKEDPRHTGRIIRRFERRVRRFGYSLRD